MWVYVIMPIAHIDSPLVKRARQEAVFLSSSLFDRCLAATIEAMEEAERSTRSIATRLELGEAWVALAKRRAELRGAFSARLDDAISEALDAARDVPLAQPRQVLTEDELALIEDAEVSRLVEASRLQQAVMPAIEEPLALLDSLMSSALGLPVVRADLNPLRPDVLCGAVMELFDQQPEPPEVRTHWVRHIAKPFAEELKKLYEGVAAMLEEQGVEEARYRLKLTEGAAPLRPGGHAAPGGGASDGPGWAGGEALGGELAPDAERLRHRRGLFPRMEDLAQARPAVPRALVRDFLYQPQWVAEHDEPLPTAYYTAVEAQTAAILQAPVQLYDEAQAARTRARAQALSVVDRPARVVALDQPLPEAEWGEAASPQARNRTLMALKGQATHVRQAMGLEAVRMLVEQVADDQRVLAPVREAFVAMEPALLRMAMEDPRFFGDDHHPARRLIESVAQRSFRYNDEYGEDFEQFMAPVRQAVRELNALPEAQPRDFATRLQAIEQDWQQQDEVEQDAQQHGLRSMQFAQERQALADKIAWEFSLRSDLDGVPAVVADFLFQDWSLVIAHAQLTDERSQLDPGGYLAVVSDLLWSVKREAALRQPARLFEVVPNIVRTLRRGLEMLGKEPAETQAFFDALMRYHDPVLRLRRLRSARDAEASGFMPPEDDSALMPLESDPVPLERPKPRTAEQPWLGRHELAAAGFEDEPESDEVSLTELAPLTGEPLTAGPDVLEATDLTATDEALGDLPVPVAAPGVPAEPSEQEQAFVPLDLPAEPAAAPAVVAPTAPAKRASPALESAEEREARARAQMARLRVGDWVDLKVRGQWRRAQLQWTSDNGTLFMFISHGGRPHSMTQRTCEKLLRNRQLRPVEGGAVVDKALRRLGEDSRPAPAATPTLA